MLYRYFGERIAIYFSFQSFYSCYLFLISIVGIIFSIIYRQSLFVDNEVFPLWAIIFIIWSIIMVRMWNRKNNEIIHKWGYINRDMVTKTPRRTFRGDEFHSNLTSNGNNLDKHLSKSRTVHYIKL